MIVFGEQQSAVNPNMPLRCLMYAGIYTFYNGTQDFPVETELSLLEAFFDPFPARIILYDEYTGCCHAYGNSLCCLSQPIR